jgi:hypothetical protein
MTSPFSWPGRDRGREAYVQARLGTLRFLRGTSNIPSSSAPQAPANRRNFDGLRPAWCRRRGDWPRIRGSRVPGRDRTCHRAAGVQHRIWPYRLVARRHPDAPAIQPAFMPVARCDRRGHGEVQRRQGNVEQPDRRFAGLGQEVPAGRSFDSGNGRDLEFTAKYRQIEDYWARHRAPASP